jgi:hypothetical protein
MKRNFLILSASIAFFCISAFTFNKWSNRKNIHLKAEKPQATVFYNKYLFKALDNSVYYNVESRLMPLSKGKLSNPNSLLNDLTKKADESFKDIAFISIAKLSADMLPDKRVDAEGKLLNESQINLLKSLNYQDQVLLQIIIKKINPNNGKIVNRSLTSYLTIVPEKETEYSQGKEVFLDFVRKNTDTETLNIKKEKRGSGRISFLVLPNGDVSSIKIENSSKLKKLDDKLINLLNKTQGKWNPARNALGEPVSQELIFVFGNQGC